MIVERSPHNPIIQPLYNKSWMAEGVLNASPAELEGQRFLLFRALSKKHYHAVGYQEMTVSTIGIAESSDGVHYKNHRQLIIPEEDWEKYGCEDPRVTKLGGKFFIFYTALSTYPFSAEGIRVGVAITKDLRKIDEKHMVTPFNAKAMALFPEKINGKFYTILTANTDKLPAKIAVASMDKLSDLWNETFWNKWYQNLSDHALPFEVEEGDHIEVGSNPLKTEKGWLVFYSHIENYFSEHKTFMIKAVLLDSNDPTKIIGRTDFPLMTPEEYHEKVGLVSNIIFPGGAEIKGEKVNLYYGASDSTVCLAEIDLDPLLEILTSSDFKEIEVERAPGNPIITPNSNESWESKATFNPAAIRLEGTTHILYRAMSEENTSVLGYATSKDGLKIDHRSETPAYTPREDFEKKKVPGGNSGCEDPRLTIIGETIYLTYTAYNGKNAPRIALSKITKNDFIKNNWNWSDPVLISPPNLDNKDAFLFPEKIDGKFAIVHRAGKDIDIAFRENLDFKNSPWIEEYRWIAPRKGFWDSKKVGGASPPLKTEEGWIVLYHGISEDNIYRVGAVLLDLENPVEIIGRTYKPIMGPVEDYEKNGLVPNVVFPCGAVLEKGKIFIYYGGADKVVGAATLKANELLEVLKNS